MTATIVDWQTSVGAIQFNCHIDLSKISRQISCAIFSDITIYHGWVSALNFGKKTSREKFLALRVRQELENTMTRLSMSPYDHLTRVLFRYYIMTGLEIVRVGIHTTSSFKKPHAWMRAVFKSPSFSQFWDSKRDAWNTQVLF